MRNTLPETNSSHLKMDGWNTFSFPLGMTYLQVVMLVSGYMDPKKLEQVQVFQDISNAKAADPPASWAVGPLAFYVEKMTDVLRVNLI